MSSHSRRLALASCVLLFAACTRTAPTPERSSESSAAAVVSSPSVASSAPGELTALTVYKTPSCGCCAKWEDHMRENGFTVESVNLDDLSDVKARLGVRDELASCHTATIGGYVVEGHVPASDVRRLLAERPNVVGISAPGMPAGSPGMEGPRRDRYDVVSFDRSGTTRTFASH